MLVSDPGAGLRPPPPIPYGLGGGADTMHPVEYQKVSPQPRRLTVEERFHTLFGYPFLAIDSQTTTLSFQRSGLSDVEICIGNVEVRINRTT